MGQNLCWQRSCSTVRRLGGLVVIAQLLVCAASLSAQDDLAPTPLIAVDGESADNGSELQFASARLERMQQPVQPAQPSQPAQPVESPDVRVAERLDPLRPVFDLKEVEEPQLNREVTLTQSPPPVYVRGAEAPIRNTTDAGDLLFRSQGTTGIYFQRRNPIVLSPYIRGYGVGQYYTQMNGAYWLPVRQDLDTSLDRFDSFMLQDIMVLKGPYSALYGPGFAFFDITTKASPRYDCGNIVEGRSYFTYNVNGNQIYGRQSVWGGGEDYGFHLGYGQRTGNDYQLGGFYPNGSDRIPTSYNSRDFNLTFGFDLSPDSQLEVTGLRVDQTGVELPGQVFDISSLTSDAATIRYTSRNQPGYTQLLFEGWYNHTTLGGNAQNPGKRTQIPQLNPYNQFSNPNGIDFVGVTNADQMSTGYRAAWTWGDIDEGLLTAGSDLRFLSYQLNEDDSFNFGGSTIPVTDASFPIPRSHSTNPGLFGELLLPLTEDFAIKTGTRVDWVDTNANAGQLPVGAGASTVNPFGFESLNQSFVLWSGYISSQYRLTEEWTLTSGFGRAMRPPSLTELYSASPFLQINQSGFTFTRGNTQLAPERLRQLDLGLVFDYETLRGGIQGFYGWVENYIGQGQFVAPGAGGTVTPFAGYYFVNVGHATLSGGEIYGEWDYKPYLMPFASLSYVEGRNQDINAPLPNFYPLQSRLGVQLHDPSPERLWTIEGAARVVAAQNRLGTVSIVDADTLAPQGTTVIEQQTPGFAVFDFRGYWRMTRGITMSGGILNFADKFYREHLDARTGLGVYQPGVTYYATIEAQY